MSETHTILGGKVRIYKRETGSNWFCATFIEGKNRRVSTVLAPYNCAIIC